MYTHSPSLLNFSPTTHHPPPPIPPLWVITEQQPELPVLYGGFPLAIYRLHIYSICLCLYFCPANMLICTSFLDSTHLHRFNPSVRKITWRKWQPTLEWEIIVQSEVSQKEKNKYHILTQMCKSESHSVVSDSLRPDGLYSQWNSPGQNTGVGSLSLLQGIFPNQMSSLCYTEDFH